MDIHEGLIAMIRGQQGLGYYWERQTSDEKKKKPAAAIRRCIQNRNKIDVEGEIGGNGEPFLVYS